MNSFTASASPELISFDDFIIRKLQCVSTQRIGSPKPKEDIRNGVCKVHCSLQQAVINKTDDNVVFYACKTFRKRKIFTCKFLYYNQL